MALCRQPYLLAAGIADAILSGLGVLVLGSQVRARERFTVRERLLHVSAGANGGKHHSEL
jgi:hypothetical protein